MEAAEKNGFNPVIVDFPLRGEWFAPNTPGDKVPSHGTDALAQTYAYDFLQLADGTMEQFHFYRSSRKRYQALGIPVTDTLCFGQDILSPVSGTVIQVQSDCKDPRWLQPNLDHLKMLFRMFWVSILGVFLPVEKIGIHRLIGNYIIIRFDGGHAFLAHLRGGSITVKEGQKVSAGDYLGQVGHTGNSTAPHLHFHLMDSPDILTAKGVPCAFRELEIYDGRDWVKTSNAIPGSDRPFRSVD